MSYGLSTMAWSARFSSLFLLTVILHLASSSVAGVFAPVGNRADGVPSELFNSLDELSRLVNIAYCVGWSGIQPPFQCLNNCDEFKGFELVTVRIALLNTSFISQLMVDFILVLEAYYMIDMGKRPFEFVWLYCTLSFTISKAHYCSLPRHSFDRKCPS